jgi:hypothetical protein
VRRERSLEGNRQLWPGKLGRLVQTGVGRIKRQETNTGLVTLAGLARAF